MMVCQECRQPITSEEAPGIGTYWFHVGRGRESTAFCGNSGEWSFDRIARPFNQPVYIVDREFKITNWGYDGMFFLLGEIVNATYGLIWDLVDIDNEDRIVSLPRHHVKEPFEQMEIEDDEPGIF